MTIKLCYNKNVFHFTLHIALQLLKNLPGAILCTGHQKKPQISLVML